MIQQVEVADGKILFPYFVDKAMAEDYIYCFASFIDNDDLDMQAKARQFVTKQLDMIYTRWQERCNRDDDRAAGAIKSGGIS